MRSARLMRLIAVFGLTACWGGEDAPPPAQATAQRQAPVAPVETAAAEAVAEYRYEPENKPDPFRSYVRELNRINSAPSATPLQRFDLSQLRITAVIWDSKAPRALVEDPSGKGYIVGEGAPIGKNEGRIIGIDDGTVLVKETYVDFAGQRTTKDVQMHLVGR